MGLDMYAHRRVHVKQYAHEKPEECYTVRIDRGGKPVASVQSDRISSVEEEVMYWNKANHIHGWFVDNVQCGVDDCKEYRVDEGQLLDLLDTCKQVIDASTLVDGSVLVSKSWNSNHHTWDEHREPGKVIKDPTVARRLLPTRRGPFFGFYEYDEDYLSDVMLTRDWTTRMLADLKEGVPGEIMYSSSW